MNGVGGRLAAGAENFSPQCTICGTPLSGLLSGFFRLVGIHRSSRNPNVCNRCNTHAEEGRIVELTVLFADLSSFTELTNALGPERTHEVVDAFLQMATSVLVEHDAFIDKYVGDAVMALFNAPIKRGDHAARAVAAATAIQARLPSLADRFGLSLRAGIGIASGWARVGRLGSSDGKDYTAIGSVVNLASRLEEAARPGEILVDQAVYRHVSGRFAGVPEERFPLKGFPEPVQVYRLHASQDAVPVQRRFQESERNRPVRVGAVVFAILGAPCAAVVLLGPLASVIGVGSLFWTVAATVVPVFDAAPIRIPMLGIAAIGTLANLYAVWHAHTLRRQALVDGRAVGMTASERRRTALVLAAAVATLLLVALELYGHHRFHAAWV
jgi:adenylate cyclase